MIDLKNIFFKLKNKYSNKINNDLWEEIEFNYSIKERYYHNLNHLKQIFLEIEYIKQKIENYDSVLFSIFYHDLIYNPKNINNEKISAEIAKDRMNNISVDKPTIEKTYRQIMSTKNHDNEEDLDTKYFLDCDLSILGSEENKYLQYSKNIRNEYIFYPENDYCSGRIKVLENFLKQTKIYKTNYFHKKYELIARENIKKEIKCLKAKKVN